MADANFSQLKRPGADPVFQRRQQRSQDLALSQISNQIPANSPPPGAADVAQAGAQAAQAVGKDAIQQAAEQVAQFKGQAGVASAGQAQQNQEQQGARQLQTQATGLKLDAELNRLGSAAKNELYDSRMNFEAQQVGQGALQESQLLDWAASKAKSKEEFQDYAQKMQQASDRTIAFLTQGYQRLEATLKAEANGQIQKMSNEKKLEIAGAAAKLKAKLQKEQAKKAGNAALITGLFTVAGAVIGGAYTGGAGAPAGAAAGGMIGSGIGGAVAGSQS